jgi:hypothetical protein
VIDVEKTPTHGLAISALRRETLPRLAGGPERWL